MCSRRPVHLLVEDVRTLLVLERTLLVDPHVHLLLPDTTQTDVRSCPTILESPDRSRQLTLNICRLLASCCSSASSASWILRRFSRWMKLRCQSSIRCVSAGPEPAQTRVNKSDTMPVGLFLSPLWVARQVVIDVPILFLLLLICCMRSSTFPPAVATNTWTFHYS